MYGYFDESILIIDGVKYCFLTLVVYREKCTEKIILQECAKAEQRLKYREEIKYTNVRSPKLKQAVLQKIKNKTTYYHSVCAVVKNTAEIHDVINNLICENLINFEKSFPGEILSVLYDKVSYRVNIKEISRKFDFVQSFKMGSSQREPGIQNADWIVGEFGENFRKQKNRE